MERGNFFDPPEISQERVLRTHTRKYLDKLLTKSLTQKEERATGFPLSDKLVKRELIITQGTIEAHANTYRTAREIYF